MDKEIKRQLEIIKKGVVDLLPEDEFIEKLKNSLKNNKPLRVKQGFDPTAPDIHLGHTVGLRKLRQFQDLGHQVVLIIGDYTGLVGDPSGRSATRPQLTYEQLMENSESYQKQFFKIVDKEKTEVHFNGEWFDKMGLKDIMHLSSKFTIARILERDDFEKRYKAGLPIAMHEFFYPLMQAYDSVMIKADIEIGATEQTFNLVAGRHIQEAYGQKPQCILTLPILVGVDGVKRMSKSLGNYIGVDESPKEIFGKVMSIPDNLILSYYELVTDVTGEELKTIKEKLETPELNPMDLKKELGVQLVTIYHNKDKALEAREEFERVFSDRGIPDDMPELSMAEIGETIWVVKLLADTKMVNSRGEARRLIKAGGLYIDNERMSDDSRELNLKEGLLFKVGKRKFFRIIK
ncbi:MAG: tyrosine--tRNA ligase [candidate division Zixibacteria bacterium]|nr:tyrosine--tRNA ligase [candidate division Zixibacteria bacterium]